MAAVPQVAAATFPRRRAHVGGLTVAGGVVLLLVAAAAILAPFIADWAPTTIDFNATLVPPGSPHHALGTDHNGMDMLSRLLFAARLDLGVAIAAVAIA